MGRFPSWTKFSVVAAAGLLSPVMAFLMAIAVEAVIGLVKDLGALPIVGLIAAGAVTFSRVRKLLRARPRDRAPIVT
jgi:hypothetical protein